MAMLSYHTDENEENDRRYIRNSPSNGKNNSVANWWLKIQNLNVFLPPAVGLKTDEGGCNVNVIKCMLSHHFTAMKDKLNHVIE